MAFLTVLWASKLFRQVLAYAAIVLVVWWGINWAHNAIIEEALEKNDAEWTVKLDDEKKKHADYLLDQEVLRAKLLADGAKDAKDKEAKFLLAQQQIIQLKAQRDSYGHTVAQLDGVLKSITTSGPCDDSNGQCKFVTELRRAYASCERDLKRAIDIAGSANDRGAECSAAVKAIKVK